MFNKPLEYLRASELARLSKEEQIEYKEREDALRRELRALVAFQDSADSYDGVYKPTIMGILKNYGLDKNEGKVKTDILKTFFGSMDYYKKISPIYEEKKKYSQASAQYKATHPKPGAPIDYFSIPALYHFYRLRKEIMKLHVEACNGDDSRMFPRSAFYEILKKADHNALGERSNKNMFFNYRSDLTLCDTPISTKDKEYKSILHLQNEWESECIQRDDITYLDTCSLSTIPVDEIIRADVLHYMFSYVEKTKKVDENDIAKLKENYSMRAIAHIKDEYPNSDICQNYLIDKYNFAGFDRGQIRKIMTVSASERKGVDYEDCNYHKNN